MEKGYTQIYTGDGKGKTTAAMGLMLRAVGANKKVYFGQFLKYGDYSETKIIKERFPEVVYRQHGEKGFIKDRDPNEQEKIQAQEGFKEAKKALLSKDFDVVILDEINIAVSMSLLTVGEIKSLIEAKPEHTELVMTGRYADEELIELAELVTEMKEIKHYFNEGIFARIGIEK